MASIAPLDREMALSYLVQLPGWSLKTGPDRIERSFTFADAHLTQDFAARVEELCRFEGHQGDIRRDGTLCTVSFWTRAVNGLHENDFVMAAKVNGMADEPYVPASASMGDVSPTARHP